MSSLKHQFVRVIELSETIGVNKHSCKKDKHMKKELIPSYAYRKNLVDFACNLSNFLTSQYKITNIKDIKPEHITAFFEFEEKERGCGKRTLVQYKSYINKLDRCIIQEYRFKAHLKDGVPEKLGGHEPVRVLAMRQEDINAILSLKSSSSAQLGVRINNLFGLRAEETVKLKAKDFDLDRNVLRVIDGKGRKNRMLSLDTEEKLKLAKKIREEFDDEDRLVPLRPDSLNEYIRYSLKRLGRGEEYKEAKTGNHSIRKRAAKKELERTGDKVKTGEFLGHNQGRIVDTYCNPK